MRTPESRPIKIAIVVGTALALAMLADIACEPRAHAEPLAGCETVPWGFLGSQQRSICDSTLHRDGSWTRARVIGVPAHYVPFNCFTSYSRYSSNSSCSGGYFQPYVEVSSDVYPVTPDTVLPDEPGHLDR
jgi:hypothetical protein